MQIKVKLKEHRREKGLFIQSLNLKKCNGEMNIKEILPLTGINMYLLISNDGMQEIRLVK